MAQRTINLKLILKGCLRQNRNSQRILYEHFYGYGLSICLRYSKNREEAVEILNDAFLKVFTKLDQYDPTFPFEGWLRRILINTAIDHHRSNFKYPMHLELQAAKEVTDGEVPLPELNPNEDLLPILQHLSPMYRMVFNLYVLEEYQHHEIAEKLGISVSTSRSNLARAKAKLRTYLDNKPMNRIKMEH